MSVLDARDAKFAVVIPARFGSSRLPGKPLRTLLGKPLVLWVYEQAVRTGADLVAVATDDVRIFDVVQRAGGQVLMTSPEHASGTDRLAEVAERVGLAADAVVVNLQGDEPLVEPGTVGDLAECLRRRHDVDMATLATPVRHEHDLSNPNVVKVVVDRHDTALYFSRSRIPFERADTREPGGSPAPLRHLGLYAYRVSTLRTLAAHPPVPLELSEGLEQLRALWLGLRIAVRIVAHAPGHGVDTEADLERVEAELRDRRPE